MMASHSLCGDCHQRIQNAVVSLDVESESEIVEIEAVEERQAAKSRFLTSRNRSSTPQKRFTDLESPKASIWKIITMITMEASMVILAMGLIACVLSISSLGSKTLWRIPILEWAVSLLVTRHNSLSIHQLCPSDNPMICH
ncbi:unnamed protein product [Microthlaspi erraticum]|uniref:Uncharacterized protein n=1 Tax=Microthlaspi erraticum TaxID=1685480 RepID=A0A6D2HRJ3_9BRAS|nr:unnamed protein product [Microthlaspi erraticum]